MMLNQFFVPSQEGRSVSRKEIDQACTEAGITLQQVQDVVAIGKWKLDAIPWLRFWTLLVASAAGTLYATVKLASEIAGDNGNVSCVVIRDVFTYLAEQDPSVTVTTVQTIKSHLDGL